MEVANSGIIGQANLTALFVNDPLAVWSLAPAAYPKEHVMPRFSPRAWAGLLVLAASLVLWGGSTAARSLALPAVRPVVPACFQQVSSPYTGTLYGVSAVAANDMWAVGNGSGTLTEHWNGAAWTRVSSPSPGGSLLYGVSAKATNDVWAVGLDASSGRDQTLTLHGDSSAWTQIASPNPGADTTDRCIKI